MVDQIAAAVLACAVLGLLVWRGFFTPPGSFGSWAMFSHISAYRARLRDSTDDAPISPWDYELRHDHFNSAAGLGSLVTYLEQERGRHVVGEGVVLLPFRYVKVAVRNGEVVRA
ncbi:hypothetical protein [Actinoplanes teichomyceticus]|uniref:Uncharacterized protein n=1 Tax=Actinoplanes teichomyceticus TaxID=1867 RepID=A0A561VLP4_ACTTI|nr:hypothetical protein [Actinoplanes teichomyceticus]TWG12533.1 hypothetical protein FHX34_105400 [Actinoplanes teichomyceticus]GIF13898.1 hypothetical protein Ate01nite_39300 [Actinoplanes teichomyceticus]